MRLIAFTLLVFAAFTTTSGAQQETVLTRDDGAYLTVRTDESGTTVIEEKEGLARTPVSPEESSHWNKVFEFTRERGKVVSHRNLLPQQ